MKIERKEKDLLVDQIDICLEPKDYLPKVEEKLKKVKKHAQIPGFRPGFAPDALIRKYYKKSILAEVIDQLLSDALFRHIEENQLTTLGRPMESEGITSQIDLEQEKDFIFHFDIGRAPEIDAKLDKAIGLTYKKIPLTDETFESIYNDLLSRNGKSVSVDKAGPDVMIHAQFDLNGENRYEPENKIFKKYLFFNKIPQSVQSLFENASVGQTLEIKAGDVFPDEGERRYMLNLKAEVPESAEFQIRITPTEFLIWKKAEPGPELFSRIYPNDTPNTEEEFKVRYRKEVGNQMARRSDSEFFFEVKNKLLDHFQLPLPDAFLKRWLKSVLEKPISDEELEKEYPAFARQTRWDLISNAIARRYQLNVSKEETEQAVREAVEDYFINQNIPVLEEYVQRSVQSIMQDSDKLQDYTREVLNRKIVQLCKEHCSVLEEEWKEEATEA